MLTAYLRAAMRRARYEILPEDGAYYGEIPDLPGVYATSESLESCRDELERVVEAWLFLRISKGLEIPVIDGIEIGRVEVV
jgi:predicted RNase H-like HicB family nuclease